MFFIDLLSLYFNIIWDRFFPIDLNDFIEVDGLMKKKTIWDEFVQNSPPKDFDSIYSYAVYIDFGNGHLRRSFDRDAFGKKYDKL